MIRRTAGGVRTEAVPIVGEAGSSCNRAEHTPESPIDERAAAPAAADEDYPAVTGKR